MDNNWPVKCFHPHGIHIYINGSSLVPNILLIKFMTLSPEKKNVKYFTNNFRLSKRMSFTKCIQAFGMDLNACRSEG